MFDVHKRIDILEVNKTQVGNKTVYDLVGNNYKGYNPILNKGGLKKYYQIYGHSMTCIIFDITYVDITYVNNTYPDGVYDYGINETLSTGTYNSSSSTQNNKTLEYGDDGYETP